MNKKVDPGFYLSTVTTPDGVKLTVPVEIAISPDGPTMVGIMRVATSMLLEEFTSLPGVELGPRIHSASELNEERGWMKIDELKCPKCGSVSIVDDDDMSKWFCQDCNAIFYTQIQLRVEEDL